MDSGGQVGPYGAPLGHGSIVLAKPLAICCNTHWYRNCAMNETMALHQRMQLDFEATFSLINTDFERNLLLQT